MKKALPIVAGFGLSLVLGFNPAVFSFRNTNRSMGFCDQPSFSMFGTVGACNDLNDQKSGSVVFVGSVPVGSVVDGLVLISEMLLI